MNYFGCGLCSHFLPLTFMYLKYFLEQHRTCNQPVEDVIVWRNEVPVPACSARLPQGNIYPSNYLLFRFSIFVKPLKTAELWQNSTSFFFTLFYPLFTLQSTKDSNILLIALSAPKVFQCKVSAPHYLPFIQDPRNRGGLFEHRALQITATPKISS